jgi:hypothetical protein
MLTAAIRAVHSVRGRQLAPAALALLVLASNSAQVVAQQQPPSGDELRSMYCIEVLRAEIGLQRHLISAADTAAGSAMTPSQRQQWIDTSVELLQGLERLESVRYRLQAYMLPRIPALDAFSLADAMRRGDADFQASRAVADQCAIECSALRAQQPLVCSTSCGDKTTLDRVTTCDRPTWLPP